MTPQTIEAGLPGEELVNQGLSDLARGLETELGLLVLVAGPSLRRLSIQVPEPPSWLPYEHRLYDLLATRLGTDAHSYYNSLVRRIVSYTRALERERTLQLSPRRHIQPEEVT